MRPCPSGGVAVVATPPQRVGVVAVKVTTPPVTTPRSAIGRRFPRRRCLCCLLGALLMGGAAAGLAVRAGPKGVWPGGGRSSGVCGGGAWWQTGCGLNGCGCKGCGLKGWGTKGAWLEYQMGRERVWPRWVEPTVIGQCSEGRGFREACRVWPNGRVSGRG